MTDDQILNLVKDVDTFLIKETQDFNISTVDLSAIINSRLRIMSASEDLQDDFYEAKEGYPDYDDDDSDDIY